MSRSSIQTHADADASASSWSSVLSSCLTPSFSTALPSAPLIIAPSKSPKTVNLEPLSAGSMVKVNLALTPAMPVPESTSDRGASTSSIVHSILLAIPSMTILAVSLAPSVRVSGGSSSHFSCTVNHLSQLARSVTVPHNAFGSADSSRLASMCPMIVPFRKSLLWLAFSPLIRSDDGRAAESDVVLQCGGNVVDLPLVGLAAQLPGQLGALRQTSGPQRMSLGDQSAGRIDHPATAIGDVAVVDQLGRLALGAQTQGLDRQQLVGREAVVQLDHLEVRRAQT